MSRIKEAGIKVAKAMKGLTKALNQLKDNRILTPKSRYHK